MDNLQKEGSIVKIRLPLILAFIFAFVMTLPLGIKSEAATVEDFYRGNTVSIYVGSSAGGLYSTFAQILSKHLGRHIPGNPTVIVEHMPGAGGIKALNFVYNAAPQDGTVLITPNGGLTKRYMLGLGAPKYDPLKWNWLGGWGESVYVLTVLDTAPVKTLKEATQKEAVIGAMNKANPTYTIPTLINSIAGTKFKIIPGYRGGAPIRLALEKGEVDGFCCPYMSWKTSKPEWIRDGRLVHLIQLGRKPSPELPASVPLLSDFAKNDEQLQMCQFEQSGVEDRALIAPPGVPSDRVAALEKAYMATLSDAEFKAAATKLNYFIDPVNKEEILALVKQRMSVSPQFVTNLKKAMGME